MTDEERVKAMRLARAIVSDILAYNDAKIVKGLEHDNFFDALKDELEEGRELFKSRVSAEAQRTNYFDRAVNDVVIFRKASVKTRAF